MRLIILLACLPMLFGATCDMNIHYKAMEFIKKNEGYRSRSYKDGKNHAICWGNHFKQNGKRIKHVSLFNKTRCEKIFYTHYFKRVIPKIPKNIKGNKYIVYADVTYQFGNSRNIKRKLVKYPERGRKALWNGKQPDSKSDFRLDGVLRKELNYMINKDGANSPYYEKDL